MNLLELATRLEQKAENISQIGIRKSVAVALAIEKDLTDITPVDTTRAVSNWQVSVGSRINTPIPPYSTTRLSSAIAALTKAEQTLKNKKPGESIYISNVLRYIGRLNAGSSRQAPAGFVERAVLIGRVIARK